MAIEKVNIINSSKNFEGNIATFQRLLDNPQALGRYVLDKANVQSFFNNFPGLAVSKPVNSNVGDEILLDEKWNIVSGGPGLPGPYKSDRQLSGNEAIVDAAFRRDRMTVGIRRYAVAVENYLQSNLLPKEMIVQLRDSLTSWATMMNDLDVATMVFRDFPYYVSETSSLAGSDIDRRVLSLFGRGVLNDVQTSPVVIMPNGKTDIEDLDDTDTLSDLFLEQLQIIGDQELGMTPLMLQDERPFFGLVVGDPDIQNFYRNSSANFTTTLTEAFKGSQWNHPLFKKTLGEFANIRMFKYSWLAANDGRDAFADWESVYKHISGSPFIPQAKVLAVAKGDETVTNLRTWNVGDYSNNPSERNGLDGNENTINIYVTVGAEHFPFFNGGEIGIQPNVVKVGADSFNRALVGVYDGDKDGNADDIEGLSYSDVTNDNYVGRFQIGESNAAGGKYKVLYTGPYYVGTLQIGDNKTPFAQMQLVYRFKVQALYKWDGSKWVLVGDADIATEVDNLKAFLGIDTNTNVIKIDSSTGGLTMQKNRKVHIFNTVRTILMGKAVYNEAEIEKLGQVKQEERDYGAVTGWGITVSKGRKLKRATDGSIRSYAIVVFKRPAVY